MSDDKPKYRRQRIDRRVEVRYKLAEPLTMVEGRRVNVWNKPGYWLPLEVSVVDITGTWYDGDELPRFYVEANGHVITKAGKRGAEYRRTIGMAEPMPDLFREMLAESIALAVVQHNWPDPTAVKVES